MLFACLGSSGSFGSFGSLVFHYLGIEPKNPGKNFHI